MKSAPQLGVKFIGYSAFLVTPGRTGEDKTLAVLDFVTGSLHVHGPDETTSLSVREKEQLKPFLQQLQAAASELENAIKHLPNDQQAGVTGPKQLTAVLQLLEAALLGEEGPTTEQPLDIAGFKIRVDWTTGIKIIAARGNALVLRGRDVGNVIGDMLQRTKNWDGVLQQIEEVGRKFKRPPYDDFISSVRAGSFPIRVHGFGIFKSGRLKLQAWPS